MWSWWNGASSVTPKHLSRNTKLTQGARPGLARSGRRGPAPWTGFRDQRSEPAGSAPGPRPLRLRARGWRRPPRCPPFVPPGHFTAGTAARTALRHTRPSPLLSAAKALRAHGDPALVLCSSFRSRAVKDAKRNIQVS